jgi:hypothetical protein
LFYAACFFEAGLLLIILPWTALWDHKASLLDFWPAPCTSAVQSPGDVRVQSRGSVSSTGHRHRAKSAA